MRRRRRVRVRRRRTHSPCRTRRAAWVVLPVALLAAAASSIAPPPTATASTASAADTGTRREGLTAATAATDGILYGRGLALALRRRNRRSRGQRGRGSANFPCTAMTLRGGCWFRSGGGWPWPATNPLPRINWTLAQEPSDGAMYAKWRSIPAVRISAPSDLVDSKEHQHWFEDTAWDWMTSEKNVSTVGELSDKSDTGNVEGDRHFVGGAANQPFGKDVERSDIITASNISPRKPTASSKRRVIKPRVIVDKELPELDNSLEPVLTLPPGLRDLNVQPRPRFRKPQWGTLLGGLIEDPTEYYKSGTPMLSMKLGEKIEAEIADPKHGKYPTPRLLSERERQTSGVPVTKFVDKTNWKSQSLQRFAALRGKKVQDVEDPYEIAFSKWDLDKGSSTTPIMVAGKGKCWLAESWVSNSTDKPLNPGVRSVSEEEMRVARMFSNELKDLCWPLLGWRSGALMPGSTRAMAVFQNEEGEIEKFRPLPFASKKLVLAALKLVNFLWHLLLICISLPVPIVNIFYQVPWPIRFVLSNYYRIKILNYFILPYPMMKALVSWMSWA